MDEAVAGFLSDAVEKEMKSRHERSERSLSASQRQAEGAAARVPDAGAEDGLSRYGTPEGGARVNLVPRRSRPVEPAARSGSQPRPAKPASSARPQAATDASFPANILEDKLRPYLVVKTVNTQGVTFAFARRWLRSERFRASMPRRCVFTGEAQPEVLIAQPMLFRSQVDASAGGLEEVSRHSEVRHSAGHDMHELIRRMGRLRCTGTPYYHPMPYFVSRAVGQQVLHADTRDRRDGGVTCDVTIPHAGVALAWLGRVNGVCGREYALLGKILEEVLDVSEDGAGAGGGSSQDTVMGQTVFPQGRAEDPFALVDEAERERVFAWCDVKPDEHAVGYFKDSDVGDDEAGAGGIVVTDRRLIYKKYHRRGAAGLFTPNARVIVKPRGEVFALVLVTDDDRHKLVALSAAEVDRFDGLLKRLDAMPVEVVSQNKATR